MTKRVVNLDFTEYDTLALLEMLTTMCKHGELAGIIYAVGLKKSKTNAVYCGATGRLAEDPIAAAGLASMLATKFSQDAIESSIKGR